MTDSDKEVKKNILFFRALYWVIYPIFVIGMLIGGYINDGLFTLLFCGHMLLAFIIFAAGFLID